MSCEDPIDAAIAQVRDAKSFYDVIGIPSDAPQDSIASSYRKMALLLHPDRTEGRAGSEAAFQQLGVAYEWLSTPEKRYTYDELMAGRGASVEDAQRTATMYAFAQAFHSMSGTGRRCQAPGCSSVIESRGPDGRPYDDNWCVECRRKANEKPCSSFGCQGIALHPSIYCVSCSKITIGKKGRCKNFGCLNAVTEEDVAAGGVCNKCRNKPKKCKEFGCLVYTSNVGGFCDKHKQ